MYRKRLQKDLLIDPEKIRKIAIRCPNWIGDAVMATPVLKVLRDLFPHSEIIGISHPVIQELFASSPFFDRFLSFSREKGAKKDGEKRMIDLLRKERPQLGILLTRSFSSAWNFYRAGIPYRLGLKDHFRSLLLTHAVREPSLKLGECHNDGIRHEMHDVDTYSLLLNVIQGGQERYNEKRSPLSLYVEEAEKESIRMKLDKEYGVIPGYHTVIAINPGAAYGSAKCWPKERFREVIERLLEDQKNRIVVIGDSKTKLLIDEIVLRLPPRVVNLAAQTSLRQLMALISLSDVLLTNDSGPMHIGSALQKPLVALFGSTNPHRTGPYNGGHVIYKNVLCSPCYLRKCPIDFRCMTQISVDEVYIHLKSLIADKRS